MKIQRNRRAQPDGFVIIAVIVVFAISTTLFGVWASVAVRSHRQFANRQLRVQAVRLAEAGVRRAIARRQANPRYDNEVWSIAAADLGQGQAAEVRIGITPAADAARLNVEATAEFPVGAVRRATITKQVEIPNPITVDES
jgi:Tfp pilus assembly protein PilX